MAGNDRKGRSTPQGSSKSRKGAATPPAAVDDRSSVPSGAGEEGPDPFAELDVAFGATPGGTGFGLDEPTVAFSTEESTGVSSAPEVDPNAGFPEEEALPDSFITSFEDAEVLAGPPLAESAPRGAAPPPPAEALDDEHAPVAAPEPSRRHNALAREVAPPRESGEPAPPAVTAPRERPLSPSRLASAGPPPGVVPVPAVTWSGNTGPVPLVTPSSATTPVPIVTPTPSPSAPSPRFTTSSPSLGGAGRARAETPKPAAGASPGGSLPVAAPTAVPAAEATLLDDNGVFRKEAQILARTRDWTRLAAITRAAIDGASWVQTPETRAALLEDLARVYGDRLKDASQAEETWRRLVRLDPAHADAIDFLAARYRDRGDHKALYDLYSAAVEATWDPNQRLEWTRATVAIATSQLRSPDLAIEAWERLFRLGDAVDETTRALSEVYRSARRWDRLAAFLEKRAVSQRGAEKIVTQREVAEAYLSGLRDQDKAAEVLEQILALRPSDPIALLALARVLTRRKDWEALAELGARATTAGVAGSLEGGASRASLLDFRRLVADALWHSGDLERALVAHDRVLELDPLDAESLKAKEDYLERTGRWDALVRFLVERSERASGPTADADRARLLGRAAELADKRLDDPRQAVALWEKRAALESGRLESLQALAHLHETLGDPAGVARALEGQLAATRHPGSRVELLRRLGEHYAHRLGDDARAEVVWREIATLLPEDRATRDELVALHRRRGDFEALDRTLAAQAWHAIDPTTILEYWRAAATNLDDNLGDPARSVRGWLRVIDLQPNDPAALAALSRHLRSLSAAGGVRKTRELGAALEAEARVAGAEARADRIRELARLLEGTDGEKAAALAAWERLLRWNPGDSSALDGLARLHGGGDTSALEAAAAAAGGKDKIDLLARAAALVPVGDLHGRFHAQRRLVWLHDPGADRDAPLAAAVAAGERAEVWKELAALYLRAAAEESDVARRDALHGALAALYERRLKDPARAFMVLQANLGRGGADPAATALPSDEIARLAEATGRHEDLLALYDVAARAGGPVEGRKTALRRRAEILETKLADGERAFYEQARLLALDPRDGDALAEARRIAGARGLAGALDALYAEQSDRLGPFDGAARLEIARARAELHEGPLADPAGALDQLLLMYRLDADAPGVLERIHAAAEAGKAWDRVLPILEARVRAAGETSSPEAVAHIAALHESKRGDRERALDLYAEAYLLRPSGSELRPEIERLAEATGRAELGAFALRLAAARSTDLMLSLELYRRLTELYGKLGRTDEALDMHRRILQVQPDLASLEVLIDHERRAGNQRELRDRLQQWAENSPDAPRAQLIERSLEIARLSREALADGETALATYARVLDLEPSSEEALAGIRALSDSAGRTDPNLELRRLRIELQRAAADRRIEIRLRIAAVQERDLDDPDGAIDTLRALVDDGAAGPSGPTGPIGPGSDELARLYRARGRWGELVDLTEARAGSLPDPAARIEALEQAVRVCEEHAGAATQERRERLYRRLLEAQPGDDQTRRRLLALLREGGRFDEMALLLEAARKGLPSGDTEGREELEAELARVLDRGLGRLEDVEALLSERARRHADDPESLLALASVRLRRGDFAGYLALREQHARTQPGPVAAILFCHLAEAVDERGATPADQVRAAGYYREARALDPASVPAMEALKAIGRRARNWRAAAALLPDPDEATLAFPARAARLRARAEAAHDDEAACSWLVRAVAVDPDDYRSWDALAQVEARTAASGAALLAQRSSLLAFERATPPDAAHLAEHVERIQRLAVALDAAGDSTGAARESQRAFRLLPSYPAAALAVADRRLEAGDIAGAQPIYDRLLRERDAGSLKLSDDEHVHALFRRGALLARGASAIATAEETSDAIVDRAIRDLRDGLRIQPLHDGILEALADSLGERGRVAAAIQHYIQALLVVPEPARRGRLYARLGRLWEDRFGALEEAGVCYDLAMAAPEPSSGAIADHDLMGRALRHYRRSGQSQRALSVLERLLPATTDPRELALLWTERGAILDGQSKVPADEEKAIEAFDMALSYDPASHAAIAGLSALLERRGDWEQLMQIFEVRAESGAPAERAEAYRQLARIANLHLHDRGRTEKFLCAAVELAPTQDDYEQLLLVYGEDPARSADRRAAIAGLLDVASPWMARVIELGRTIAALGERRWAWSLLSMLMSSTMPDPGLKALVLELRKEFEKSDNTGALRPETHLVARHPDVHPAIAEVLEELDPGLVLGRATIEQIGATGIGKLDERTAVGKTFAAIAGHLGLEGAVLWRAQDLDEPYAVAHARHGEPAQVVVRAELLQLLATAETGFLFSTMLELARPGARVVMALPAAQRGLLVPALLQALGLLDGALAPEAAAMAERIREGVTEDLRAAWAARLAALPSSARDGERYARGLVETARRVGLVAAADLRFVARLLTRMDDTLPKMQTVGKIEDLDEFIRNAPPVRRLLAFAATAVYGRSLAE